MSELLNSHEGERQDNTAELLERIDETDIVVYEELSPVNLKEARASFLADDSMVTPSFEYDVERSKIEENLKTLRDVLSEADSVEDMSREDRLSVQILGDANVKKNAFVIDCLDYNAATSEEEKKAAAEMQSFSNEALYGKPDERVFYSLLQSELSKIDEGALSPEDHKIYESLLADIGEIDSGEVEPFRPSPDTVKRFGEMINTLYEGFFSHIPEDKEEFSTEEACAIVNEIIREEIGEDATAYRAVMSDKAGTCSVNHQTREIFFPVERANGNFTRLGLKQIVVHEFGTHAYRAMAFEEDELPALSREMPGNEEIDEGIAKCCEQAVSGKYKESGIEHYINIGLASFKGKNFREVFEIQRRLLYLKGCRAGKDETEEEKDKRFHSSDNAVFTRTMRCFRGTGELPNNKDLVYYTGAAKVWRFIEENIDDPDLLDNLFLSGKTDLLSEDQRRLIYEKKTKAAS